MQSYRLTVSDYQKLLDRGWRRSGKYCYYPINKTTCCPNYSITCKTTEFKLSSSQRRCIENLNSYLINGTIKNRVKLNYAKVVQVNHNIGEQTRKIKTFEELKASSKARDRRFVDSCEKKAKLYSIGINEAMEQIREKWNKKRPVVLPMESYLFPKISSLEGFKMHNTNNTFQPEHKLEIRMCYVKSKVSQDSRKDEHAVMVKYQKAVHKESLKEWTMPRYCDFLVSTPLITEPLQNYDYLSSTSDDNDDTFSKDVCDDSSSDCILVKPPELPTAFGTYHCSYYLDDKLIAVGVLDVLPKCITTVYFFYNPEFAFLNLGVYSALIEISMVRRMCNHFVRAPRTTRRTSENKLIYYYLGFYVHECKKMHYKTRFRPSYLLCSKTHQYVPTEICLKKLEGQKYAPFSDDDSCDQSVQLVNSLDQLLDIPIYSSVIPNSRKLINYLTWIESNLGNEYVDLLVNGYLITYAQLIGLELLPKLCLKVNAVHRTLLDRHRCLTDTANTSRQL